MKRHLVTIAKYYGMSEERIKSINYANLEAKINDDFKIAHNFYMNCVVVNHMDYELYLELFIVIHEHEKQIGSCFSDDYSNKFAYTIVKCILNQKKDLVRMFFELKPIGDYCELVRMAIEDNCIDQSVELKKEDQKYRYNEQPIVEIKHISADEVSTLCAESVNKFIRPAAKADSLLLVPIPDTMIMSITNFVNDMDLFCHKVNSQEIHDFLHCKEGVRLQMKRNTLVSFFLLQLSKNFIIKKEWASIIAANKMLISSSGLKFTDAHHLTASASRVANKRRESLSENEKRIYAYVEGLYKELKR